MENKFVYLRYLDEYILEFEDEEDLAKFLRATAYTDMDIMGWETDFESLKSLDEEKLEEMARALDNRGNLIWHFKNGGDGECYTTYHLDLGAIKLSKKYPNEGHIIDDYLSYFSFSGPLEYNCKFSKPVRVYICDEEKRDYIIENLVCADGYGYLDDYNFVLEYYAEEAKKVKKMLDRINEK